MRHLLLLLSLGLGYTLPEPPIEPPIISAPQTSAPECFPYCGAPSTFGGR